MEDDISRYAHSVEKIAVDLVEDVFGRSAEEDCACFGVLALSEKGEVVVADLGDVEEAALSADVLLCEVVDGVDNVGTSGAGNAVVVGLSYTAQSGDVVLEKEVLGEV